MDFHKITEQPSQYSFIECMSMEEVLTNINREDQKIAGAVRKAVPFVAKLVKAIYKKYKTGGRLFYLGAGTSGRLGILDAAEIPPTYGVSDRIIGVIAGGDPAIRQAVESAEDHSDLARGDLDYFGFSSDDSLIGIAASGTTPYVLGGLKYAEERGAVTGCITNNPGSPVSQIAQYPIEVIVGPEFITGSTRMKSGTSQKMVLNMISTSLMIKAGRVKGNKMVNMQLNNNKLINRGVEFVADELNVSPKEALKLLEEHHSVKNAIDFWRSRQTN